MTRQREVLRWSLSCVIVLVCYSAAATAIYTWKPTIEPTAAPMAVAMIELAPIIAPPPPAPPPEPIVRPAPAPEPDPEPIEKVEAPPEIEVEVPLPPAHKPKPRRPKRVEEMPPTPPIPPAPQQVRETPPPAAPVTQVAVATRPSPDALANYYAQLVAHIRHNLRYPRTARSRSEEGISYVYLIVDRHGRVLSHRLDRSSKRRTLDEEAVAVIERAAPLPPFPAEIRDDQLEFRLPVQFTLR